MQVQAEKSFLLINYKENMRAFSSCFELGNPWFILVQEDPKLCLGMIYFVCLDKRLAVCSEFYRWLS